MRRIGIRQFQQNFHKEIKDLPFALTRSGEVFATVVAGEQIEPVPSRQHVPFTKEDRDKAETMLTQQVCELNFLDTYARCNKPAKNEFTVPTDMQFFDNGERPNRKVILCDTHYGNLPK